MIVAVSDTSPLNYLVLCRTIDVLPRLFGKVVVPPSVLKELSHEDSPAAVNAWTAALPPWVEIQVVAQEDLALKLHPGERDAISLAMEIHADIVLLDDRAARTAAKERGLTVVGTLGILERAAVADLLDLPAVIDALGRTTFKIAPSLVKHALERDARRRAERTSGDEASSND